MYIIFISCDFFRNNLLRSFISLILNFSFDSSLFVSCILATNVTPNCFAAILSVSASPTKIILSFLISDPLKNLSRYSCFVAGEPNLDLK